MARSNAGRRRSGAARANAPRAAGLAAAPGGAASLDDAARPRLWQDLELRPFTDPTDARPLFDFAALPWPDPELLTYGWGAFPAAGGAPLAAVLAERAGRAVLLHGPVIAGTLPDPLALAGELLAAALPHAAALGADTAFARPQGLDRVWIRHGFIPVPESALPAAFAGREGVGLYGWRGGSALWSFRPGDEDDAAMSVGRRQRRSA